MDTSYIPARVDLDGEEHTDAKEVNDLVNAIVDKDGDAAQEAIEAVFALIDNILDPTDRFRHLFKVFSGVLSNQAQARFIEKPNA